MKYIEVCTLGEFCFTMIGRADIEGSKSNVAMNAWLPQASYPCGNLSDTSCLKPIGPVARSSVKSAWFKSDLEVYQTRG